MQELAGLSNDPNCGDGVVPPLKVLGCDTMSLSPVVATNEVTGSCEGVCACDVSG